ncbi:CCA tRNA nucleotidyltransferase [Agromyces cerinus]|uniref:tRNA nucleotidyltransferase (CCA-adding enzyme) n=1 Tax=Agromyces cerinus subsp. cerinus TaxID=232089 RepID=A0A1N6E8Y1_9MICO|nr:HD domain-containing protein [Agromyces cerinus]SIN79411.1 tRNA nucleotidyltransferase (CCA-adding enzyme) [Agromyces cerinus subsp. cerinus]
MTSIDLVSQTPAAAAVVVAIADAGGRPLLVGGCVRDALLGRPGKDVDIEVHGLTDIRKLTARLSKLGSVDHRGQAFGVLALKVDGEDFDVSFPRRDSLTGAGHRGFDIHVDSSLSLEEAFGRRDFTINAMGWDPINGELIDLYGGADDLEAGILRHTTSAFREDPLRVLRAVQFAGRFGFGLAPETVAECQDVTDSIASAGGLRMVVSTERVWEEWRKLARRGTHWPNAMQALADTGMIRFSPELAATRGVQQDPGWHAEGDVWTHLALAAEQAARNAERDDLSASDREVAVLGALVHDLGKVTHTQLTGGRITSRGHAAAGVAPASAFLRSIGAPHQLVMRILPIVREHMSHVGIDRPSPSQVRRLIRRLDSNGAGASIRDWARVVDADCAGRGPSAKTSPAHLWLQVAADTTIGEVPRTGILTGQHLIERGYTPGPGFKPILAAALGAQDDGVIHDEQSALLWLDRYEAVDR